MEPFLLVASTVAAVSSPNPATVTSGAQACALVKASFSATHNFPRSRIGYCDFAVRYVPRGYYVLILHSTRRCNYICSSWLGSFAVEKANGRVFEWNTADWRLGR